MGSILVRSCEVLASLASAIGQAEEKHVMAYSARILALIEKIEAADAAHFARLRESAKKDTAARAATLWKKRAGSVRARRCGEVMARSEIRSR